jgi:hypothetical protein
MNNEPVAWMEIEEGGITEYKVWREPVSSKSIPLYTHPSEHDLGIAEAIGFDKGYKAATAKTLTDEEIKAIWHKVWHDEEGTILDFGKAILKKAGEK